MLAIPQHTASLGLACPAIVVLGRWCIPVLLWGPHPLAAAFSPLIRRIGRSFVGR